MPELPEVETMRRGIAAIVGSTIAGMSSPRSKFRPIQIAPPLGRFRRRVEGRRIVGVGRAGKRLVIELDSQDRIIIEPRMTGRVLLAEPPDRSHLRVVFELVNLTGGPDGRLLFWDSRGLGVVSLMSPDQFARELAPGRLGPDALRTSAADLRQRLGASRRAIKVALLDQRAVAGVGNLYASEILHRAGLHPAIPCNRLCRGDWQRLHAAMQQVLNEAIELEGSTLADGNYRTAEDRPGGFQGRHRVYQRAGEGCLGCGRGTIVRTIQAQRSTFFCPVCQDPRKARRLARR
jgi:formamidopyrimidine-DNA glycosylase